MTMRIEQRAFEVFKCPQCHEDVREVYEHASFGDGLGSYWHCGECHRQWCEPATPTEDGVEVKVLRSY